MHDCPVQHHTVYSRSLTKFYRCAGHL